MTGLKIARGLELPVDVAGESTAILAKKGAGKSNTAKVIVEEVLDHGGVQVVVLDPIGHWWSLRAGADGKPRGGYAVAVFGGMHGDLPLEETAGRLLAQTVVESGQSIVLDVSGLDSNGAMQRFVYEFLEELYKLKQAAPTPLLLVLEEADEFAPQDPKGANVPRMVGAANRISKRGRGRGIGMLYVTQRSAALNKNVLDQSDTLIVMRTMGPRDRAAIEGWVKHQDAAGMDEVLPSLPSLQTGEAWIWTPERNMLERVKVRKARTFDSSKTPKAGEAAIVASVKPIDVNALGEAIKATVERAKENDPGALRKRVLELNRVADDRLRRIRELEEAAPSSDDTERVTELEAELARVTAIAEELDQERDAAITWWEDEHLRFAGRLIDRVHDLYESAITEMAELRTASEAAAAARESKEKPWTPSPTPNAQSRSSSRTGSGRSAAASSASHAGRPAAAPVAAAPSPAATTPSAAGASSSPRGDDDLTGPARKILGVLAQFPDGRTRAQIAVACGYPKKGSTIRSALGLLRTRGLITPAGIEPVIATAEGLDAAGDVERVPTGGRAAFDHWLTKLSGPQQRVLELLYEAWPDGLTREQLAELTGYPSAGSTLRSALGRLRNVSLITPAGREPIRITHELAGEEAA